MKEHCSSDAISFHQFYDDPRQLDFVFESDRDINQEGFRCQYNITTDRNQGKLKGPFIIYGLAEILKGALYWHVTMGAYIWKVTNWGHLFLVAPIFKMPQITNFSIRFGQR